ncbi:RimK family alpha-L-glutamate ligase [Candidatus Peregrinibacteria bacterium]|nr:RimK family alpha-L-glutamate ligase [Candidatus Peregrinibacteria bacterium]
MKKKTQKKTLRIGIYVSKPAGSSSGETTKQTVYKKKSSLGSKMLAKTVREKGYKPVFYYGQDCQLLFTGKDAKILYKGKPIKGCDVLISRMGGSVGMEADFATLKQFELMNMPVVNRYLPVSRAKNKLRTMQILTKGKVPVPNTVVVRHFEYLDKAIKQVGGYPIIVKSAFGAMGKSVAIIESRRSLFSALDILWRFGQTNILLIQEYVAESDNSDYRAFVIGDKVVAAMKRTAKKGEFRSNVHQGGDFEEVELTPEEKKIAIRSTKLLGLDYSGVDIMRSSKGPVVIEVNSNPGLAGINSVSSVDVPTALLKYSIDKYKKSQS